MLRHDLATLDSWESWRSGKYNKPLWSILNGMSAERYLQSRRTDLINGEASADVLKTFIHLMLLTIHRNIEEAEKSIS
jgi:hypothetical protein